MVFQEALLVHIEIATIENLFPEIQKAFEYAKQTRNCKS